MYGRNGNRIKIGDNLLMKIKTTYKVKIKHYNHIFKDTVRIYRSAVDYIIKVCLNEWDAGIL